jgi:hypothetical protein
MNKLAAEQGKAVKEYDMKMAELTHKQNEVQQKMAVEKDKIKMNYANMANDLAIAKTNAKNRATKAKKK